MAAPRPTPTRLKILTGNPGHRKLPKDEPQPEPGLPPAPAWLDAYARQVWANDGPGLVRMQVVGQSDWMVFASYCQAVADVRRARQAIKKAKNQLVELNPVNGATMRSAYYNIVRERSLDALRFGMELGITPAARVKVTKLEAEDTSPLKKLLYAEPRRR